MGDMDLSKLLTDLEALTAPERIKQRTSRGYVRLEIPEDEYDAAVAAVTNLKLADLVHDRKAIASFGKLVNAVKLVLAIEAHPFQNPTERVKLGPKSRNQLRAALKVAGELEESKTAG